MKRLALLAISFIMMVSVLPTYAQIDTKQFDNKNTIKTFDDSLSYTIGFMTGYRIWKDKLPINKELYIRAIIDGLDSAARSSKRLLTQDQMDKTFFKYDSIRMYKRQLEFEAKEALRKKRGEELLVQGAKFLEDNKKQADVKVTESGLQYKVITMGTGRMPVKEDVAEVNFIGKFTDGQEFTNTYKPKDPDAKPMPAMIPIDRVPPGWAEGMLLMPVGSKFILYIPSDLAFGEKGMMQNQEDIIPPNATLIIEIEMLNLHDKSETIDLNQPQQQQQQPAQPRGMRPAPPVRTGKPQ